jgi:hypothetical protein
MAITFQKRQKEMKRLEKRRMKEERRAQKKLEKRAKAQETDESATAVVDTPDQGADRQ